jgi:hypothetical protein
VITIDRFGDRVVCRSQRCECEADRTAGLARQADRDCADRPLLLRLDREDTAGPGAMLTVSAAADRRGRHWRQADRERDARPGVWRTASEPPIAASNAATPLAWLAGARTNAALVPRQDRRRQTAGLVPSARRCSVRAIGTCD